MVDASVGYRIYRMETFDAPKYRKVSIERVSCERYRMSCGKVSYFDMSYRTGGLEVRCLTLMLDIEYSIESFDISKYRKFHASDR